MSKLFYLLTEEKIDTQLEQEQEPYKLERLQSHGKIVGYGSETCVLDPDYNCCQDPALIYRSGSSK